MLAAQQARSRAGLPGPIGPDDEEDEDEDEEGGGGAAAGRKQQQQPQRRNAIYNVDALHDRLEDIGWGGEGAGWDETLALTSEAPLALSAAATEDDLERELAFYTQVRRRGGGGADGALR